MISFHLPDLGEGLKEAEIVAWHVSAGDHVVADQPLLSVETDKAVVEIPAPASGRVLALYAAAGDVVAVDAPLLDLESNDATHDAGTVVGALPSSALDSVSPAAAATAASTASATPHRRAAHANASPAVRALASRRDVSLDSLRGSGPHGTITRADVDQAAAAHASETANDAIALDAASDLEPLRGVRRAMSRNMALAHAQVVPATLTDVADVHDWRDGDDITLRLIRAVCVACAQEPALNASYLGLEQGRRLNAQVDLGIAIDTAQGLFVPVVRDAAQRSPAALRSALAQIKADVRARSVARAQLHGATITLSNFGMLDGLHAALVVMPPQVAIVGAGRMHERVVAVEGKGGISEIAIRRALPLSITFDHRAVMGAEAARFMTAMRADLCARA